MVSAELAVALPVVVLLLSVVLGAFDLGVSQLRCVDAARTAARAAARGDSTARVDRLAEVAGPPGATVRVVRRAGLVVATVTGAAPRLARVLPLPMRPSATAVAVDETALDVGAASPP